MKATQWRQALGAAGLMVVSMLSHAQADTIQQKESGFKLRFGDNATEQYRVVWTASVDTDVREEGHPAIPAEFKFVDTRQCFWTITSRIERNVVLVNRAGERFAQSAHSKVYTSDFQNKGSDWVVTSFRKENCNDARARRESDVGNARSNVIAQLAALVGPDFEAVKSEFKKDGTVEPAS